MIFVFDDLELDVDCGQLRRAGHPVKLDGVALRVLGVLARRAPELVSREHLTEAVWQGRPVDEQLVTAAMARLRKALGQKGGKEALIGTAYGRGYRLMRRVERRNRDPERLGSLDLKGSSLPMVGRAHALATLRRALQETCAGHGRVCALVGEPGIGKSYLVEALTREAQGESVRVAWGFCREAGDTAPLAPWLRIIREMTSTIERLDRGLSRSDTVVTLENMLRALDARGVSGLAQVVAHVCVNGTRRQQLFDTIARFLALASAQQPWVIVLEDLHRADDASLMLLDQLVDRLTDTRVMLVTTARSGDLRGASGHARGARALMGRSGPRIVLERLRPDEVKLYVANFLDDYDERIGHAIHEKSGGNPFFMSELVRQLLASGRKDLTDLTLPAVSLNLLRQHVADFGPQAYDVLSAAAVIGRSFELSFLSAVTGLSPSIVIACIDDARASDVLVPERDSNTAFSFIHELQRTALYDALAPAMRRRWHLRVADELEGRGQTGDVPQPSELAYHRRAALPDGDIRKAVRDCRMAAVAAATVSANDEVVRHVRHALEALAMTEQPSVRLRMHMLYITALFSRGCVTAEFASATRELVVLARDHGDPKMLACGAVLHHLHPGLSPMRGARAVLSEALEVLPADELALRAAVLGSLSTASLSCFTEQAYERVGEAASLARTSQSRMARYVALLHQLYLHGGPDHIAQASALDAELTQLAQGNPVQMPLLSADLALLEAVRSLQQGDLRRMTSSIERGAAHCRNQHHAEPLWLAERMRAMSQINAGDFAQGMASLEVLHERAHRQRYFGTAPFCAFDRVLVFGDLPATPKERLALCDALDFAASDPPSVWALKLRALAAAGLREEAESALNALAGPAEIARLPCDNDLLGTLGHVAHAVAWLGERRYAAAVYDRLEPYARCFSAQISFYCEGAVPQILGVLARALGRESDAIAHFEQALVMNTWAGLAPQAVETRMQLTACLVARARAGDAGRATQLRLEVEGSALRHGRHRLAHRMSEFLKLDVEVADAVVTSRSRGGRSLQGL